MNYKPSHPILDYYEVDLQPLFFKRQKKKEKRQIKTNKQQQQQLKQNKHQNI